MGHYINSRDVRIPLSVLDVADSLLSERGESLGSLRFSSGFHDSPGHGGVLIRSLGYNKNDRQAVVRTGFVDQRERILVDLFSQHAFSTPQGKPEQTLDFDPVDVTGAGKACANWLEKAADLRVVELCPIPAGTHSIRGDSGGEVRISLPEDSRIFYVIGKGKNYVCFGQNPPEELPEISEGKGSLLCDAASILVNTDFDSFQEAPREGQVCHERRVTVLPDKKKFRASICTGGDGCFCVVPWAGMHWIEVYW